MMNTGYSCPKIVLLTRNDTELLVDLNERISIDGMKEYSSEDTQCVKLLIIQTKSRAAKSMHRPTPSGKAPHLQGSSSARRFLRMMPCFSSSLSASFWNLWLHCRHHFLMFTSDTFSCPETKGANRVDFKGFFSEINMSFRVLIGTNCWQNRLPICCVFVQKGNELAQETKLSFLM